MTILETFIKLRDDLKLWVTNNLTTKADISYVDENISQKSQVQMITNETTDILPTLQIHKLTQMEYDQKNSDGTLDENAIYLTPDEEIDLSPYATIEQLNTKADTSHTHDDVYYTEVEIDTMLLDKADMSHKHNDIYYTEDEIDSMLAGKSDTTHSHDDAYDPKGAAEVALNSAKSYADNVATSVKNELLNGAGEAYDTLKELGDLISENADALEVLEDVASGKADATHTHEDIYYTKTELDVLLAQKSQVKIIKWEDDD